MSFVKDFFYFLRGRFFKDKSTEYKFAFLVHSRGYSDIYRKYPSFRFLPKFVVVFLMNHFWPITLSRVTGVYSKKDKKEVRGYVLGITATSDYLIKNRSLALKKIRNALYLAKGRGVKIVGLGGLTSSLSQGGLSLLDIDINITTGHAYTAFNVTQNLFKLVDIFGADKEKIKVTVVGAAGSVGSTSALILARAGFKNILIVDIRRKLEAVEKLKLDMLSLNPNISVQISYSIDDIKDSDFVITATNTPEALVTMDKVSPGMIIIDDAQPSDIHRDVLKMNDVLVIEAGVVDTPGIHSNFNYGLKNKTDNFCCMAELLVLASHQWEDHYVINRATLENVDIISEMGNDLGFKIASFQNFMESVSIEKINHVMGVFKKKHGI